ncbi:unnamed protein product [Trichogramma brassicae]|uniref:Uncharacterized protein n=1 Tax=Trichogramma brassicae TaxID=86971 RepID=A0A6H5IY30_9HYME|nr:unnamed protein product [Trichogramma brassicae]
MAIRSRLVVSIPVSGKLFSVRLRGSAVEFLVGGIVIKSYDKYERCHVEWWDVEEGEEAPICGSCGRHTDTPGEYVYGPLFIDRRMNCIESAWLTTEVSFVRVVSGSRTRGCDAYEGDGLMTSLI